VRRKQPDSDGPRADSSVRASSNAERAAKSDAESGSLTWTRPDTDASPDSGTHTCSHSGARAESNSCTHASDTISCSRAVTWPSTHRGNL